MSRVINILNFDDVLGLFAWLRLVSNRNVYALFHTNMFYSLFQSHNAQQHNICFCGAFGKTYNGINITISETIKYFQSESKQFGALYKQYIWMNSSLFLQYKLPYKATLSLICFNAAKSANNLRKIKKKHFCLSFWSFYVI